MKSHTRLSAGHYFDSSRVVASALVLVAFVGGCSGSDGTPAGSGGGAANGGDTAASTGGVSASGGKSTMGGAGGTAGGALATGGTSATGGAGASGGTSATGGAGGTTGGTKATGGASVAGGTAATGGTQAPGGTAATGGTGAAAGGTVATGGTKAAGGATATGGTKASGGTVGTGGAQATGGSSSTNCAVPAVIANQIRWVGRVDLSTPSAPKFAWSGTGLVATVTGSTIAVRLSVTNNNGNGIYFQPVIDGTAGTRFAVSSASGVDTTIGTGLSTGDHKVELYRETEGSGYGYSTFLGFTSGTLKDPPAYGCKLIEVVGDSISAGYGDLGASGCSFSTSTESAYKTYAAVAARAVGADASILAASGWGIYQDYGCSTANILPSVYSDTLGTAASPTWNFVPKPQAVIINLGTNDFSCNANLSQTLFSTAYSNFITTVRSKYPAAMIYCAYGPMLYGTGLTNAEAYLTAIVSDWNNNKGDPKVKLLKFEQQTSADYGCDSHPNVSRHQKMADVLTAQLKSDLGW